MLLLSSLTVVCAFSLKALLLNAEYLCTSVMVFVINVVTMCEGQSSAISLDHLPHRKPTFF